MSNSTFSLNLTLHINNIVKDRINALGEHLYSMLEPCLNIEEFKTKLSISFTRIFGNCTDNCELSFKLKNQIMVINKAIESFVQINTDQIYMLKKNSTKQVFLNLFTLLVYKYIVSDDRVKPKKTISPLVVSPSKQTETEIAVPKKRGRPKKQPNA